MPTYNMSPDLALCSCPLLTLAAAPATAPVEVMIVGVYHMSIPAIIRTT